MGKVSGKKDSQVQSSYSGQQSQPRQQKKTLQRTEAKVNKIIKKDKKKPAKKKPSSKKKQNSKTKNSPAKKRKPTQNKKKQEDELDDQNFEVFLPGQKYATPSSADPTRIFYQSCLKQIPNNIMAKNWLFEHGLFSYEQQQEIFQTNKAVKLKK